MKISVDIDCTPEEARTFLGLPDVGPLQQRFLEELERRMRANLEATDAETLFRAWMPLGIQSFEQAQKAFWSQFGGRPDPGSEPKRSKKSRD